ncbi:MAG: hypothetical protein HN384_03535 [Nitrosopumilus sp.]|nr:hypothetical protein [Nitrosopumilus sp.]MBT3574023.1 hypothetical protein [Nitrosopumilus sp.]MBT4298471.1 hypothetical protein [Nitrosopumilus sp.]MBT4955752.1 hypothetical protein [Nitrosopumilus sp.]MBT6397876.1 hypothetical protein [Nitrosopumilus sp.]
MIHIKYFTFKNKESNEIQISNQKENNFKTIYQIINQKIIENKSISLEQLIIFCSFKNIKKIRDKTNYQKIEKETIKQFQTNKNSWKSFKNIKIITIEIMVDKFPKNIIKFSI